MKRLVIPILIFAGAVIFGHVLTLKAVPAVIMKKAMRSMQASGLPMHKFVLGGRVSPQTQTVVRPSPDLVYSICLFDFSLTNSPLEIRAGYWSDYGSISFYDAKTNSFATVRVGTNDQKVDAKVILITKSMRTPTNRPSGEQVITSPSKRGLILIRRLAPSAEKYQQVQDVANADSCQPVPG